MHDSTKLGIKGTASKATRKTKPPEPGTCIDRSPRRTCSPSPKKQTSNSVGLTPVERRSKARDCKLTESVLAHVLYLCFFNR